MDDFNMNNKAPLNSSDQNNEQPAAETRNTAPQNEQPVQAPQSEQPMQQPQAEQPAQAPQSEQPQAEEPRTPFQTPVQHPEFRQAQQQTGFGEVPPMSQKPHTPKNKKHSRGLALGLCGVAAACLLFAGGAVVGNMAFGGNANSDSGTSASTSDSAPTLQINSKPESDSSNSSDNYDTADGMAGEDIYKKVNPSVVSVISTTAEGTGSGSGVIMSKDGYIITNNHVVEGGSAYEVMVAGETYEADLVGTDPSSDVAVLKAKDASGLTVMELGDSDNLTIGEWVMTLGSPFGLEQSVATGIVSATSRSQIMDASESMQSGGSGETTIYPNMIQTDAAINPGNSGGALVDDEGKLIGINTLITSYSGNYSGVGFAIPVNYAVNLAQQIIAGETPTHAQLGVSLSTVNDQAAASYGLAAESGAYVAAVSQGSGAEAAGLQEGDIITALDGESVEGASDLMLAVRGKNPGDTVKLTVNRNGQEQEISVTLGDDAASQKAAAEQKAQREQQMPEQGQDFGRGYGDGNDYGYGWGYGDGYGDGYGNGLNLDDLFGQR